ncbi:AMP-binding protein, partial [Streptomyces parvus]
LLVHEHAPLTLAQQAADLAAETPLFTSLLNYRHDTAGSTGPDDAMSGALEGVELLSAHERTNYPLAVTIDDAGTDFGVTVQAADPIAPHDVCALVHTVTAELVRVLENESATELCRIEALGGSERHRMLTVWNNTDRSVPQVSLTELLAAQAVRTPEATAVVFEGVGWSYAELDARANRLARLLITRGVGPESLVAVCMERSADLVVSLLAVLKAGGAYVPIDPEYPAERISYVLEDAQPALVLTSRATEGAVPEGADIPARVQVDGADVLAQLKALSGEPVDSVEVLPSHVAYVIYTSGSTGRPKGVAVPHQGVVNRLLWMQDTFPLDDSDRVVQKTPFGFDVSVWEFFWPLITGAGLVVARPGGHRDTGYLTDLIRTENVTVAHFVPSMLRVLLHEPDAAACTGL